MKKYLLLGAAFMFAACNESGFETTSANNDDSKPIPSDTLPEVNDAKDTLADTTAVDTTSKDTTIKKLSYCDSLLLDFSDTDAEFETSQDGDFCKVELKSFSTSKTVDFLDKVTDCVDKHNLCEETFNWAKDKSLEFTVKYNSQDKNVFYIKVKGLDCRYLPNDLGVEDSPWISQNDGCALKTEAVTKSKSDMLDVKDNLSAKQDWDYDMTKCEKEYTCYSFVKKVNDTEYCLSYDYDMDKEVLSGATLMVCGSEEAASSSSTEQEPEISSSSKDVEKPASSSSKVDEKPISSSSKDVEKPKSSSSKVEEKPVSSSSKDVEKPVSSSSKVDEKPASSSSKDVEKPESSSSNGDEKPMSSSSKEEEKPESSSSKEDELLPGTGSTPDVCETATKQNWQYLNSQMEYGCYVDARDNQPYKTITIGEQTWIAENMNYKTANSLCYTDSTLGEVCDIYGQLYTWEDAQNACPAGYHLPDNSEWNTLITYVESERAGTKAGISLKAVETFQENTTTQAGPGGAAGIGGTAQKSTVGDDYYGMSILGAGYAKDTEFVNLAQRARYWISEKNLRDFAYNSENAGNRALNGEKEIYSVSVRCLKDSNENEAQ